MRPARTLVARATGFIDHAAKKVFPDHWSFLLGEIAMYSLLVLFATGIALALFYDAGEGSVVYHGSYEPLQGVEVSRHYQSVLDLSFEVRGGLLLRQTHHWAALVFTAAIVIHAARILLTGAYRHPRRLNYLIGLCLLVLSLATGFFGVSLPDDLLSGSGARIGYSMALSLPVVGPGLTEAIFGGEFPAEEMIRRFWVLHVFVLPLTIAALFAAHMTLVWRQTHTQLPGEGRAEDNVVGDRLWPVYLLKSASLFAFTAAVLTGLGALVQVNPVWAYGPFRPTNATVPAGPDWYLMFVEGALRVMPNVSVPIGPYELPSPFVVAFLGPAVTFALLAAWPFVEARLRADTDVHHLLELPRERPLRTAAVCAGLGYFAVLTFAANHDFIGGVLGVSILDMTWAFRALLALGPPIIGIVAFKVARDLGRRERPRRA